MEEDSEDEYLDENLNSSESLSAKKGRRRVKRPKVSDNKKPSPVARTPETKRRLGDEEEDSADEWLENNLNSAKEGGRAKQPTKTPEKKPSPSPETKRTLDADQFP